MAPAAPIQRLTAPLRWFASALVVASAASVAAAGAPLGMQWAGPAHLAGQVDRLFLPLEVDLNPRRNHRRLSALVEGRPGRLVLDVALPADLLVSASSSLEEVNRLNDWTGRLSDQAAALKDLAPWYHLRIAGVPEEAPTAALLTALRPLAGVILGRDPEAHIAAHLSSSGRVDLTDSGLAGADRYLFRGMCGADRRQLKAPAAPWRHVRAHDAEALARALLEARHQGAALALIDAPPTTTDHLAAIRRVLVDTRELDWLPLGGPEGRRFLTKDGSHALALAARADFPLAVDPQSVARPLATTGDQSFRAVAFSLRDGDRRPLAVDYQKGGRVQLAPPSEGAPWDEGLYLIAWGYGPIEESGGVLEVDVRDRAELSAEEIVVRAWTRWVAALARIQTVLVDFEGDMMNGPNRITVAGTIAIRDRDQLNAYEIHSIALNGMAIDPALLKYVEDRENNKTAPVDALDYALPEDVVFEIEGETSTARGRAWEISFRPTKGARHDRHGLLHIRKKDYRLIYVDETDEAPAPPLVEERSRYDVEPVGRPLATGERAWLFRRLREEASGHGTSGIETEYRDVTFSNWRINDPAFGQVVAAMETSPHVVLIENALTGEMTVLRKERVPRGEKSRGAGDQPAAGRRPRAEVLDRASVGPTGTTGQLQGQAAPGGGAATAVRSDAHSPDHRQAGGTTALPTALYRPIRAKGGDSPWTTTLVGLLAGGRGGALPLAMLSLDYAGSARGRGDFQATFTPISLSTNWRKQLRGASGIAFGLGLDLDISLAPVTAYASVQMPLFRRSMVELALVGGYFSSSSPLGLEEDEPDAVDYPARSIVNASLGFETSTRHLDLRLGGMIERQDQRDQGAASANTTPQWWRVGARAGLRFYPGRSTNITLGLGGWVSGGDAEARRWWQGTAVQRALGEDSLLPDFPDHDTAPKTLINASIGLRTPLGTRTTTAFALTAGRASWSEDDRAFLAPGAPLDQDFAGAQVGFTRSLPKGVFLFGAATAIWTRDPLAPSDSSTDPEVAVIIGSYKWW